MAMTLRPAAGGSTLLCPRRSTTREIRGPQRAVDSVKVAETAPARPYCPRIWDSIVMIPMPVIDSGIRATKPAAEKAAEPGASKRAP